MNTRSIVLGIAVLSGCATKRVLERPIMAMGDVVGTADARVATAAVESDVSRREQNARRDSITGAAMAGCSAAVCEAVARGEVALGMTEAQVFAATRTTETAWTTRRSPGGVTLVARSSDELPRDVLGSVAMVQLRNGQVASYTYREMHGLRVVDSPASATMDARAAAVADGLIRDADQLVAIGDMAGALDRYDRASVLKPQDSMLEYRIASLLDKQLRPVEALMRYQTFLHKLELEKIEARGNEHAKLADAIARARERIIVLEKR